MIFIHVLTLKAPITAAADDILIFLNNFSKKLSPHITCDSSAKQTFYMKY